MWWLFSLYIRPIQGHRFSPGVGEGTDQEKKSSSPQISEFGNEGALSRIITGSQPLTLPYLTKRCL